MTNRTSNSAKNLVYALLGQGANYVAKFVVRTVLIYTVAIDYLGLNGLFSNILQILSLAELGIGVAISFSLYEPIANADGDKIAAIMRLFKKLYCAVGTTIIVVGISLTPFIPLLIANMPDIPHLDLIYILYVLNSGVSYFFSYKAIYVTACQKNYLVSNNAYIFNIICSVAQCIILLCTHEYLLFMLTQVAFTLASNVSISLIANKMSPDNRSNRDYQLDRKTKKEIRSNIAAAMFQRLGFIIVVSTDSVLLSIMFGLTVVGQYSNYVLIINAVEAMFGLFFTSISASVGNLRVTESSQRQMSVFHTVFFLNFAICSLATTLFGVGLQPLIHDWAGDDYVMPIACCAFLIANFYLKGMRRSAETFNNAYGLLPVYKYMFIPESIINIVASVLLAMLFGPVGVIAGTTISYAVTVCWIEPYVLYKHGFNVRVTDYAKRFFSYSAWTVGVLVIALVVFGRLAFQGIFGLCLSVVFTTVLFALLWVISYRRSAEFKHVLTMLKSLKKPSGEESRLR